MLGGDVRRLQNCNVRPSRDPAGMAVPIAAGIDTWSPSWTIDIESIEAAKMRELATSQSFRGSWMLPEAIAGHRVGWFPGHGLLFAEGHPGGSGQLGSPDGLPAAFERLVAQLREAEVPIPDGRALKRTDGTLRPGFAGVRRVDATVDLQTGSRREGLSIMAAAAAVATRTPRTQADIWFGAQGLIESVLLRGHMSGRIMGRMYDKGLESGMAAPGRLLRPEDQRRYRKADRPALEGVSTADVRRNFRARFEPMYKASKGVIVAPVSVLTERLLEHVDAGDLPRRTAENLAGYLMLEAAGGVHQMERTTRWRRERKLRELGLVSEQFVELLAAQLEEDRGEAVELRPVLEACLDTDLWDS